MQATRILALQQPGRTNALILRACTSMSIYYDVGRSSNSCRKRVFILGPAHHVYMDGCALSQCTEYSTPLGNLPLDEDSMWLQLYNDITTDHSSSFSAISELRKTDMFRDMDYPTDCDEHSIEMHLPYVRKMFEK